jgi:methionyl-tRNA formyltransferase
MGTSSWVIPVFERVAQEHSVSAVFTRAPKPAGRGGSLTKSPVHDWAESRGLPVYTDIRDFDLAVSRISGVQPRRGPRRKNWLDIVIVASYGVMLRGNVLNAARFGCVNIHPSDLPKYRGPSPITTAIMNGDAQSAVCLMRIVPEIDAGGILRRRPLPIGRNDKTADVERRLGPIAAEMLSRYLQLPRKNRSRPQKGDPTFTRKWTGRDEWIDWMRQPHDIHNQVRAIGGRAIINGMECKILETRLHSCMKSQIAPAEPKGFNPLYGLEIITIQPAGKRPMPWRDFVNGQRGRVDFGPIPAQ